MILQLVERLRSTGLPAAAATQLVLRADPFDLILHMEQLWQSTVPFPPQPAPGALWARRSLWETGAFSLAPNPTAPLPAWDHLGYAYVLENTRAVQIMRRVVRGFRSGEGLGIPSLETQQWLDTTEALLFGAANPIAGWLSTSTIRPDPESVRRNAYWRFFGLDLAFGTEDNRAPVYDKASNTNTNFQPLFEELLFELWQAMSNVRNTSGVNVADDDRIYRIAEALNYELNTRRQNLMLSREELAAVTALGWIDLTLSGNSAIVEDLRAEASSADERLRLIGARVGMQPHSRSASLLSMAADLSILLRTLEGGVISGPQFAWVLYTDPTATTPNAIGPSSRRVITEWAAATGKDLKVRGKPVEVRRQLVAVK